MKQHRVISMLVAATLSTGMAAVQFPMATAQETTTQTMAEQYQPVYENAEERTDSYVIVDAPTGLPRDTKFKIYEPNFPYYAPTYFEHGPLITSVYTYGDLHVSQAGDDLHRYGENGFTTRPRILVTYPDGSTEIITATVKMTSTMSRLTTVEYADAWIAPNSTEIFSPTVNGNTPEKYAFVLSEELEDYRSQGWQFSVDPVTGNISVSAPSTEDHVLKLTVNAHFEDGSSKMIKATFRSGVEPQPEPDPDPEPQPDPAPKKGGSSFGSSS